MTDNRGSAIILSKVGAPPIAGMNELGVLGARGTHSPDSDCNSNPHQGSASCLSNTSSQDIDFIQDNSDYQWFLDYGYRDNNHTSILSLAESYEARDLGYYDTLAKNMDANLAEADIESFRTEDIHALLTNLPPMCTDQLSQENNRQGESYASMSNSMLGLDFNSHSNSSSRDDSNLDSNSMSICKSELLFSPVKEVPTSLLLLPPGGVNFSVDSLDCDDLMLTCQATNKDNYTIAFEGSGVMYDEDDEDEEGDDAGTCATGSLRHWILSNPSEFQQSMRKSHAARLLVHNNACGKMAALDSMSQSDTGNLTTWSKLRKRGGSGGGTVGATQGGEGMRRHPSGNNNQATLTCEESSLHTQQYGGQLNQAVKSQSMPNLNRQRAALSQQLLQHRILAPSIINHMYLGQTEKSPLNTSNSSTECCTIKRRPVKVFNIQHQSTSGSGGSILSEMATSVDGGSTSSAHSKQQNFSLVKLFMKQKSISAEGMSTGLDQSSLSENWPEIHSNESNLLSDKQQNSNFEDSLLITNKFNNDTSEITNNKQTYNEKDNRHIKKQLTDFDDQNIQLKSNNNNNNNSSLELSDYNTKRKLKTRSTNTKRKTISGVTLSSDSSNSSFTNSKLLPKHVPIHLMNKSIQTSTLADITNKSAPYKLNGCLQKEKERNYKVIEPTFLSKLKKEGEEQEKPVYILYPNYVLPNLDFLNDRTDSTKVILLPQPMPPPTTSHHHNSTAGRPQRPLSCNDVESLIKRRGINHIRDWDSLHFLLPHEYQRLLAGVPEVRAWEKEVRRVGATRPRSDGFERTGSLDRGSTCSSSSGGTQPSSGYRGSSTILSDSSPNNTPSSAKSNPLFVYRYDSATSSETSQTTAAHVVTNNTVTTMPPTLPKRNPGNRYETVPPPRPPLPRGILRKSVGDIKMRPRYSMFEMTEEEFYSEIANKRRSLQEPYAGIRNKRLSETEDEGVDAGTSSSSLDSTDHLRYTNLPTQPSTQPPNAAPMHSNTPNILFAHMSHEDLAQLEDFLQQSTSGNNNNNSSANLGGDVDCQGSIADDGMLQLRSQVSRFLALKINQEKKVVSFAEQQQRSGGGSGKERAPNNSPNVSAMLNQRQHKTLVDMPIHEEDSSNSDYNSPRHKPRSPPKHHLIAAVTDAVERIIHGFSAATNQPELDALGDSVQNPSGAKLALMRLCPALYAVLSDGLKGALETSFGPIGNSVWQVVEASAQQGPLTKALNDLVMKINGEDVITEGLVKFNAFVFGLLNVRSLDAWLSYLRTRESILRKHYEPEALLVQALMGGTEVRQLLDSLIATVQPLALLPFQFDLLFEYRLLHDSLKKMDTYQQVLSPTHQFKSWKTDASSNNTTADLPTLLPDLLHSSSTPINVNVSTMPKPALRLDNNKIRPRSYVDGLRTITDDVTGCAQRRWSGISPSSKLFQAYDKLGAQEGEEYTDSLEATPTVDRGGCDDVTEITGPESLESNISDDKPLNGRKFKKLQRRWEMLSGRDTSPPPGTPTNNHPHTTSPTNNCCATSSPPNSCPISPTTGGINSATGMQVRTGTSKIPRPVTSPVKPSGIPVLVSPNSGVSGGGKKKVVSPQGGGKRVGGGVVVVKGSPVKKPVAAPRTSRLDQLEHGSLESRPLTRPSSLPYKPNTSASKQSKLTPPRRAISGSVNRKPAPNQNKVPKTLIDVPEITDCFDNIDMVVRTLSHRIPSESGHLSYNEGERLKVVLEVDSQWLLCCRGTQKGLVPRSAVIAYDGPARF